MAYQPEPIDTSHVTLTPDLLQVLDVLARHVHDLWARQRLGEGWQYGPHHDAGQKTTPSLVPFPLLPEDEKAIDRVVATELLRAVIALGFRVVKEERAGTAGEPEEL